MLTRVQEDTIKKLIVSNVNIAPRGAQDMLDTIAELRAQVEQLQLDVQQADLAFVAKNKELDESRIIARRTLQMVAVRNEVIAQAECDVVNFKKQLAESDLARQTAENQAQIMQDGLIELTRRSDQSFLNQRVEIQAQAKLIAELKNALGIIPWRALWALRMFLIKSPAYTWIVQYCPESDRL